MFGEAPDRGSGPLLTVAQLPVGVLLSVLGILVVITTWSQRPATATSATMHAPMYGGLRIERSDVT